MLSRISPFRPISVSNRNSCDGNIDLRWVNPFQPSVPFDIEISHLISSINQRLLSV